VVRRRPLSLLFNVISYARVWRNNHLYDLSNVASSCGRCYDNFKCSLVIVSTFVLHLTGVEAFLETSQCTLRTQQRVSGEKSELRDMKRADFIRYWRRSGLKNADKPKIFIKKKTLEIIRTTSFIRFWRRSGLTEVYCTSIYHHHECSRGDTWAMVTKYIVP